MKDTHPHPTRVQATGRRTPTGWTVTAVRADGARLVATEDTLADALRALAAAGGCLPPAAPEGGPR